MGPLLLPELRPYLERLLDDALAHSEINLSGRQPVMSQEWKSPFAA